MYAPTITHDDISEFIKNLEKKFEDSLVATYTTCEIWDDKQTHYILIYLHANEPKHVQISYKISGGVHDWVVIKLKN